MGRRVWIVRGQIGTDDGFRREARRVLNKVSLRKDEGEGRNL